MAVSIVYQRFQGFYVVVHEQALSGIYGKIPHRGGRGIIDHFLVSMMVQGLRCVDCPLLNISG